MKCRKTTVFVLVMLLSSSISAAFSSNNSLSVVYEFTTVPTEDGCGSWMIEGAALQRIPGEPMIPLYHAVILLPEEDGKACSKA